MFKIESSRDAEKSSKATPDIAATIRVKLERWATDPLDLNNNVRKLEGWPGFRLRAADWRVIYEIQNDCLIILIAAVSPRGGACK